MKRSDIYPEAEDGGASLPPAVKWAGLHPLAWIFIVVMSVAGFMAYDHLDEAGWERGPLSEEHDDDDD